MDKLTERTKKIMQESVVGDIAVGFEPDIEVNDRAAIWHSLCQQYLENGYHFVDLLVAMDLSSLESTIKYIAKIYSLSKQGKNTLIATNVSDIKKAKAEKKLAVLMSFQGTNPLASDLAMLDIYFRLGVRRMIIAYNTRNAMGDGCTESNDAGLSFLGKQLIQAMNQIGIIPDCSHVGYQTSLEIMALSKKPVVFSHSNVFNLAQHPRNLPDHLIDACAKTKGVIGINGIGVLLGGAPTPERYFKMIDYISSRVGSEYVSIGSDFLIYPPEALVGFHSSHASFYPGDYLKKVQKEEDWKCIHPSQLIEIGNLLLQHGYTDAQVKGIFGENYLRVLAETEKSS